MKTLLQTVGVNAVSFEGARFHYAPLLDLVGDSNLVLLRLQTHGNAVGDWEQSKMPETFPVGV